MSNNPSKRLEQHNKGLGAKYTRAGRPWVLVYLEMLPGKSEALKREIAVKKLTRRQKLNLIQGSLTGQMPLADSEVQVAPVVP